MTRTLTVAALQSAYGADLQANISRTRDLVREAAGQGAQVILPSELFQGPYFCVTQEERWFHAFGCRRWFQLTRDTVTNRIEG